MTVGVFAIAGCPLLSGFFSKDEILYQAFTSHSPAGKLVWVVGVVTSLLTSFYMFRLWFKTFFGLPRFAENAFAHHSENEDLALVHSRRDTKHTMVEEPEHDAGQAAHSHGVHESPLVMTVPLMLLALLAVVGGYVGVPVAFGGHNAFEHFLQPVFAAYGSGQPTPEPSAPAYQAISLTAIAVFAFLLGLLTAYVFYFRKPGRATQLAARFRAVYSLLDHKYWVDEIYGALIVSPLLLASRWILGGLVDTAIVGGAGSASARATQGLSAITRRMQSGNIRSYAGWLALGAAAVIAFVLFGPHPFHR